MQTYILKRILHIAPVVIGVTFIVYLMMHLMPVDPALALLTQHQAGSVPTAESSITEEQLQEIRERLGLDKPFIVQYGTWLFKVMQGDMGNSFRTGRNVSQMVARNIWSTLELGIAAMFITVAIGLPLGVISAVKQNTWWDTSAAVASVVGVSMPVFWKGLLLMWLFALVLGWFPSMGTGSLRHLVLPATALGVGGAAIVARLTRSSLVEVLKMEYITTARSKGLSERRVIYKHGLRNSMIPVVTILGLSLGRILSGAVIIENVFGRPGLGRIGIEAIYEKDFPVVQGTVLIIALSFIVANLVADITYAFVDPRIRYD